MLRSAEWSERIFEIGELEGIWGGGDRGLFQRSIIGISLRVMDAHTEINFQHLQNTNQTIFHVNQSGKMDGY